MNDYIEFWKPIPNYEGLYEASNLGRIKSVKRKGRRKEIILLPRRNKYLYLTVQLSKNGIIKELAVHRLVYEAFHGAIPIGFEINHKDENRLNNVVENLEILTHRENLNYGTRNQRASISLSKAIYCFDKQDNFIKEYSSLTEASKQLDIPVSLICKCLKGERKSTHGYIWKYKAAQN